VPITPLLRRKENDFNGIKIRRRRGKKEGEIVELGRKRPHAT